MLLRIFECTGLVQIVLFAFLIGGCKLRYQIVDFFFGLCVNEFYDGIEKRGAWEGLQVSPLIDVTSLLYHYDRSHL